MVKVYLVNHTHWDREWYFSEIDSLVLSEKAFSDVLDELESHSDANFCLDGQLSIVDDYCAIHPEDQYRIRKLVAKKQLFVGPWYTQTDALFPDTESILRNLAIGITGTKKRYGNPMMIGYLPDTFGFNAQMPTLLRHMCINSFMFWRGIKTDEQARALYFNWKGLGVDDVVAINFPRGYYSGQITLADKAVLSQYAENYYDPNVKFQLDHVIGDDVLMPSGYDQMDIVHNLRDTVDQLNKVSKYHTLISNYPDFAQVILDHKSQLPDYQGELRMPAYSRVHRSIGGIRHEIKRSNVMIEQKLIHVVEPLTIIGESLGVWKNSTLLENTWKKVLKCQAHDSLGGCVTDNVALDIDARFKEANEMADGIENIIKRRIADAICLSDHQVLIFNPTAYAGIYDVKFTVLSSDKMITVSDLLEAEVTSILVHPKRKNVLVYTPEGDRYRDEPEYYEITVKGRLEMEGLGYKALNISHSQRAIKYAATVTNENRSLITSRYGEIEFCENRIDLIREGTRYKNFISLEDTLNEGDTYDFSPLPSSMPTKLPFEHAVVESQGSEERLVVSGEFSCFSSETLGNIKYQLRIWLDRELVRCRLTIENGLLSHRLRVVFNHKIQGDSSIARIQGGYVVNKNRLIESKWSDYFQEKPVNLFIMDKAVSISDSIQSFTFLSLAQKEYEVQKSSLYITLMTTTGQLGKPNLSWRPGRASGDTTDAGHKMIPTPLAQEMGEHTFDFAFSFDKGRYHPQNTERLLRRLTWKTIFYQKQELDRFKNRLDNKLWEKEHELSLPKETSIISVPDQLQIGAIFPDPNINNYYVLHIRNISDAVLELPKQLLRIGKVVDGLGHERNSSKVPSMGIAAVRIPMDSVK